MTLEDDLKDLLGNQAEEPEREEAALDDWIGRYLYNVDSGVAGTLGKDKFGRYVLTDNGQMTAVAQPGLTFLDPVNRALLAISAKGKYDPGGPGIYMGPLAARVTTASAADLSRFGLTTADTGRATRDYAAEQASQQAFEASQAQLDRDFRAEQERLDREQRERLDRLNALTALTGQFVSAQSRARETLAGLQSDPFRFAAALSGQSTVGTTPTEAFRNQLNAYINTPIPQANAGDLASINAAIGQLQGLAAQGQPQAPGVLQGLQGMAMGGSLQMGVAPSFGTGKSAVLVGDGAINGDEEVLLYDHMTGRAEVVPLSGGAQAGATFNPATLKTIAPYLYKDFGFTGVPSVTRSSPGYIESLGGSASGGLLNYAQQMGINPSLVRDASTGQIYSRQGGFLRAITQPSEGLRNQDVFNLTPAEIARLGPVGAPGTTLESLINPSEMGTASAFGPVSVPFVQSGALLPAPYRIAGTLNRLRLTNPDIYNLILSAYGQAGFGLNTLEQQVQNSLVRGGRRQPIGLR